MVGINSRRLWDLSAFAEDNDRFASAWSGNAMLRLNVNQVLTGATVQPISTAAGAALIETSDAVSLAATALPDLIIDDVEIEGDSISAGQEYGPNFRAGDEVTLEWDVDNRGSGSAGSSRVAIWLISDVDGIQVETNLTSSISAGGSDTNETDTFTIPATLDPGLYGIRIIADDRHEVTESNEGNNEFLILIRVDPAGKPDLVVDDVEINGDPVPKGGQHELVVRAGDQISLLWDVDNQGTGSAPSSKVGIYLSVGGETIRVDTTPTDNLAAGSSDNNISDSFTLLSTLESGVYEIELRADYEGVVSESNEGNNSYKFSIRVEGATPPGTDQVREGTDTLHSLTTSARVSGTIEAEPISGDVAKSDGQGGLIDKDWYKVLLDPGKFYTFDASAASITTGKVVISLYETNDLRVKGPFEGATPSFTFDMTGQTASKVYYLAVSAGGPEPGWEIATGNYSIGMTAAAPPPTAVDLRDTASETSAPIGSIGYVQTTVTSLIGPADADDQFGDKDVFELTLEAGKTYRISMTGAAADGFAALAQSIFTVRSINSFNTILGTSSEGSTAVLEFEANQGGQYFLRAGAGGANYTTAQGGYRLQVQGMDTAAPVIDPGSTISTALAVALANGSYAYSGLVGGGDTADMFKVIAPTAGTLNVTLTGLTADLDLLIQNSSGGIIAGPSYRLGTQSENLAFAIGAGQTVYIKAYPATPDQGQYTLNVALVAPEPEVPTTYRTGDHLFFTLAEFMLGAYPADGAPQARERLQAQGWSFFHEDNIAGTPFASTNWEGVFYDYNNAQAVVARYGDTLVISFRGTDFGLNTEFALDVVNWGAMRTHYEELRPLTTAVDTLIKNGGISKVYVTGHSLGAAMVDIFMYEHSKAWGPSKVVNVTFSAITFAHPDVTNGNLPSFVDDRVTSFHNANDVINIVDTWGGHMPWLTNTVNLSPVAGFPHGKKHYWEGAKFLYESGVTDYMLSSGMDSFGHNDLIIARGTEINNTLTSRKGGALMLGGYGNDTYVVVVKKGQTGDTIIEVNSGVDTLHLTVDGFFDFNGQVKVEVGANGRDLIVIPVNGIPGLATDPFPAIRIYNHFTNGRVENIKFGGVTVALPSDRDAINGWGGWTDKTVSAASIVRTEAPNGTVSSSVSATGGPGHLDTVSFQPLKSSITVQLDEWRAQFSEGLSLNFNASSAEMSLATASGDDIVQVDITDMENVIGSNGDDLIRGNNAANWLRGADGNDELSGGQGNDYLDGGSGTDSVFGGGGEDLMDGGAGADSLSGGADSDSYFVDDPADFVAEGATEGTGDRVYTSVSYTLGAGVYVETLSTASDVSADPLVLAGNELDNRILGNAGANTLYGMGGNDRLEGLAGDDIYVLDSAGDVVVEAGGQGYDRVYSTVSYTLAAGVEVELLSTLDYNGTTPADFTGNEFDNALYGNAAANLLIGGGGNDYLYGAAGADRLRGGTGDDGYVVDNIGDVVEELPGEGIDTIWTTLATYSLVGTQVERLGAASEVAHDFRGNAGNNGITGGAGNDVLRLYDGGDDTVDGGGGNDSLFFIGTLTAADVVNGGSGVDTLVLQGSYAGGLTLSPNIAGIENVSLLAGSNTNFGEPGTNRYDYVLTTSDVNFAAGVQARVNGSALLAGEDFTFNGSAETNASFVVYGGKGVDTLTGGLGNDIFFYAEERFASGDTVNGGAGYDGMFLRGNYTIDFNAPGYTGLFTNIENLTLTSATDERYARGGGAEFDYNLILSNAIVKPGETLTVSGTILMASETMILDGSQETDGLLRLFGGKANDTLKGGGQADLIHGNLGADTLAGGGGADIFRYQSTAESTLGSMDRILDFTPGTDKLELTRIDANSLAAGDQAFTWIGSSAFSGVGAASAGQLRAYNSNGTWFVEGDTNGDGVADLVISLTLQGSTPIGTADFLL